MPGAKVEPKLQPDSLQERYAQVKERVAAAARAAGRSPESVLIVAVTKFAEPDQVRTLVELGHRDFGENRVQHLIQQAAMVEEFLARARMLPGAAKVSGEPVRWHMIGHLQRNKARKVVEFARLIHSVDSLRLAEELQQIALRREQSIEVLLQVNCSGEKSKFGCPVPAAIALAEQIDTMLNVRVRGLMTMAALDADPAETRETFARCRELFEEMKRAGIGEGRFDLLSMGMTNDFEAAIAEGANIVRIGTAIFGAAKNLTPDDDDE